MKLASIERILDVQPIEGADRIEAAKVLGFWTVAKRGEFKPGDLCVWHNPDTVVDTSNPAYDFLRGKGRLRTARFKGQVSQGLALPVRDLFTPMELAFGHVPANTETGVPLTEGSDVSEAIKIKKYEKPEPRCNAMSPGSGRVSTWPSFLMKTDEVNIQSYPALLREFLTYAGPCILTKKYDGSSATYYRHEGKFGVCSRNQELEGSDNIWARMAENYKLSEVVMEGGALQGEIVGPGIQGNPLKLADHRLYVFDGFTIQYNHGASYWIRSIFEEFCLAHDLNCSEGVAVIDFYNPPTEEDALKTLLEWANKSEYAPGVPCEGLVLRPLTEQPSRHGSRNRLSAKIMSQTYVEV